MLNREKLSLKINELYHDFEAEKYHDKHGDIFDGELSRWDGFVLQYLHGGGPLTIMDIGTGSGFVPLRIAPSLSRQDRIICTDISKNILLAAKKNIQKIDVQCQIEFVKVDGSSYDFPDGSVNRITVNSVLHHIPDLRNFFHEADRLLLPGGRMIIAHEPNANFFGNNVLWGIYRLLSFIVSPITFLVWVLRTVRLYDFMQRHLGGASNKTKEYLSIIESINDALKKEGYISKSLTDVEIASLIDYHSPTAGKIDREKGIDMHEIIEHYIPRYTVVAFETYNHVYRLSHLDNPVTRFLDKILRRRYPKNGAAFYCVLEKG